MTHSIGYLLLLLIPLQTNPDHQFGTLFYSNKQYDILEFIVQQEHKFIVTDQQKGILVLGHDNLLKTHFRNSLPGSFDMRSYGLREHIGGLSYAPILYGKKANLLLSRDDKGYRQRSIRLNLKKQNHVHWQRVIYTSGIGYQLIEYQPQPDNDFLHFVLTRLNSAESDTIFFTKQPENYNRLNTIAAGDYKLDFTITNNHIVSLDARTGLFRVFDLLNNSTKPYEVAPLTREIGFKIAKIPMARIYRLRFHYDSTNDSVYLSASVTNQSNEQGTLLLRLTETGPVIVPYKPKQSMYPKVRIMDIENGAMYFLNIDQFGSRSIFKYAFD